MGKWIKQEFLSRPNPIKFLTVILLIAFCFFCPGTAIAQDTIEGDEIDTERALEAPEVQLEGLTMETRVCLGNLVRQGCYFPVKITLENNGPSRQGELRIVSEDVTHPFTATFKAECDIPTNSKKSYYVYPYILNNDSSPALYIQYVENSLPLATNVIELDFLDDDEKLWVEVADEGADFVYLSGITLPDGSSFADISIYATEERAASPYGGGGYTSPYFTGGSATDSNNIRYNPVSPAMVWVRPQNLPDRVEGYQGVDGIIMNTRRWDALNLEQRRALAEYVISGGAMIMWLGEDQKRYQGSFLTGAFDESGVAGPYALTEPTVRTTMDSLRTIPGFSGNRTIIGDFPCTYAVGDGVRTIFSDDDTPILQHITFGRGDILLSGLDLKALKSTSSPVGLSNYSSFMIGYLMSLDDRIKPVIKARSDQANPGYNRYSRGQRDASNPFVERSLYRIFYDINNALQSDKLTALPSLAAIAYFLVIYILIVGPINYYILLKMRHREWLWYTIPIIVTAFIILTYSWAMQTKGNRLTLTRVNILDVFPAQEVGWQSSYYSIFSPIARRYDVELETSNLIRELQEPSLDYYNIPQQTEGNVLTLVHHGNNGNSYVDGAYIKLWTEEHFESNGAVYNSGDITVESVTLQDHQLYGKINYALDYGLESPFIFYNLRGGFTARKIEVDDNVLQDESALFNINLDSRSASLPSGITQSVTDSDRAATLRENALSVLNSRPFRNSGEDEIILAGWLASEAPMPMTSPRVRNTIEETLVLIHIPIHIEIGQAPIEGVRGRILGIKAAEMEITEGGNLLMEDGIMLYALTFPSADPSIAMPESLRINIATIKENVDPLHMSIFNHSSASWESFSAFGSTATNYMVRVNNLGRYLSPDGRTLIMKIEGDDAVAGDIIALGGISVNAST